jgi:TPR repeat protein
MNKVLWMWLESAECGSSEAQMMLGIIVRNGQGVKQNFEEAVRWYL